MHSSSSWNLRLFILALSGAKGARNTPREAKTRNKPQKPNSITLTRVEASRLNMKIAGVDVPREILPAPSFFSITRQVVRLDEPAEVSGRVPGQSKQSEVTFVCRPVGHGVNERLVALVRRQQKFN